MRFIHITDTHIGKDPEFTNYGHSPLHNFEVIINTINTLPFHVDFVLHTGDVVEDASEAAYKQVQPLIEKIELPIYFAAGNHDDRDLLQKYLLDAEPTGKRFDYTVEIGGFVLAVFDTRGPIDPGGHLEDEQLEKVRELCTPDGPPLIIAMHHQPIRLDVSWLDEGNMIVDNGEAFVQAIAPARNRIRGVFFGHVHRAFQVTRDGILYASAPSAFAQLQSYPGQRLPLASSHEPYGFSLVTIDEHSTIVRQHHLARPY
jgi:3',5'-cyclic-AMP phosphodiesterase